MMPAHPASNSTPPAPSVRMRVLVVSPPAGVQFAIQVGRSDLLPPSTPSAEAIQFDFSLRLGSPLADGSFNFLGQFAQGTPADRFVYLNSGKLAGQAKSAWERRAKIKLAGVPRELVEAALGNPACLLQARVLGTMGDGGPICASVRPQALSWELVHER